MDLVEIKVNEISKTMFKKVNNLKNMNMGDVIDCLRKGKLSQSVEKKMEKMGMALADDDIDKIVKFCGIIEMENELFLKIEALKCEK